MKEAETKQLSPLEEKMNSAFIRIFVRVPLLQKLLFLDHLRIMVKGGLPMVESLDVLSRETSNQKMRAMIADVKKDVEGGKQLSQALEKHPKMFPTMYVKMIAAGETGGQLEGALEQAVVQMRKAYDLTSAVRGAMIYPSVIVVAMGGIGIMMITVVIPQITSLFKEFNTELPLATRILIRVSDMATEPVPVAIAIASLVGLVIGFLSLMRHAPPFRAAVHRALLFIPILGGIAKQINLARFSLTLSSLLKSAIPVVEAISITADTCSNVSYQSSLKTASDAVKAGRPLSGVLSGSPKIFPPMVVEMISVGEQTGEMEKLLSELANFYNDEVGKTMKNFTTIIEPIIIVVIGVAVGGMAMAVIMPMYTLVQNF